MPTNILLIMADQLRADALACNGNPVIDTPNLDRLARTGVNCTACYTPAPICVPARAALATGCYPHRCTGTKNNEGAILPGLPLLPAELAATGYRTYATGKLHYLPYRAPGEPRVTHGFQVSEVAESGRVPCASGIRRDGCAAWRTTSTTCTRSAGAAIRAPTAWATTMCSRRPAPCRLSTTWMPGWPPGPSTTWTGTCTSIVISHSSCSPSFPKPAVVVVYRL